MNINTAAKSSAKKGFNLKKELPSSYGYDRRYIDMRVSHYFHLLEMKIADTKSELLNWFIKMFIGQITGFISILVALASIIKG